MKKTWLLVATSTISFLVISGGIVYANKGLPFKEHTLPSQTPSQVALNETQHVYVPDPAAKDLEELRRLTLVSRQVKFSEPETPLAKSPTNVKVQIAATREASRGSRISQNPQPKAPQPPSGNNQPTAPQPKPASNGLTSIIGTSQASLAQLETYARKRNPNYPLPGFSAQTYFNLEKIYRVRADIAFLQMIKETNALKFGGDVLPSQHNPAGLGATGGVPGNSFATWALGMEAQVQHLYAYGSTNPLPWGSTPGVDTRFKYVSRGCAPYVEWLGIPDNPNGKGWATDPGYGKDIMTMLSETLSY